MQTGVGRRDGFAADLMLALLCGTATVVCFPIGGVEVVLLPGHCQSLQGLFSRFQGVSKLGHQLLPRPPPFLLDLDLDAKVPFVVHRNSDSRGQLQYFVSVVGKE